MQSPVGRATFLILTLSLSICCFCLPQTSLSRLNLPISALLDDGSNSALETSAGGPLLSQLIGLDQSEPPAGEEWQQQQQRQLQQSIRDIYIVEDKDYPRSLFEQYAGVGQVSGIAALPSGDVAIFHRADREWTDKTFGANFSLASEKEQDNLIKSDTIMIIERENGTSITSFGSNLFYMPHSVASDNRGNLWVTDVGRHQVMRLPTSSLQVPDDSRLGEGESRWLKASNRSRLWPDIILGEAFVAGSDNGHFCQPSEVKVSSDGRLVFVADGYCNQRVMVFTGSGKFLLSFGEEHNLNVVHSLTLIEEHNLICVADRENGRILCFRAGLDGNLASIGQLVVTVNYPLGRVFAIEAISSEHLLVSSNRFGSNRYDLAALNPFSKELKQTWTSSDLLVPHSLARTSNGQHVYAADLSKGAHKKLFKFDIFVRTN